MADWLVVLSEDNWEICKKERLLGLGRDAESRLNRMANGDHVWIYINKKHVDRQTPWVRRIRAVVRIAGPVRHLAKPPWRPRGPENFPFARPIRVEREFDITGDILRRLSFAKANKVWGIRLLNAPLALDKADVHRLESAGGV
jgi:predicted RNA-binding protein